MVSFEEQIQAACDARQIPGVVILAESADGKFKYQQAFGPKSPKEKMDLDSAFGPKSPKEKMDLDSAFVYASCTKLLTSIAVLQCVERGQIGLDDDIRELITEFKDAKIITGFEGEEGNEKPVLKDVEGKITLRHLLTHSSGLAYDKDSSPLLDKWCQVTGRASGPSTHGLSLLQKLSFPLLFEPGTSWIYGMNLDLAGLVIMRLNHTSLESYFWKHLFDPLGIDDISFHPETNEKVRRNRVKMTVRQGIENPMENMPVDSGGTVEWTDENLFDLPVKERDEFGGQGAIGSGISFMKVLLSLLHKDGKLLSPSTVDQMFTPQLPPGPLASLNALEATFDPLTFGNHPDGTKVDYGLGGMVVLGGQETGRREGTLLWTGLPNLMWTIDRSAGLAAFYASNIMPAGDYESGRWQRRFETEMYRRLGRSRENGGCLV